MTTTSQINATDIIPHENERQMDIEGWNARWESNPSWHAEKARTEILDLMKSNVTDFTGKVFVPLCGASLDMIWLAEEGLQVVGVEVSRLAIDKFYQEIYVKDDYKITESSTTTIHKAGNITIYEADLYNCEELTNEPAFDLIFDRASLIAINWEDREKYIDLMMRLLGKNISKMSYFLQGMDYNKGEHLGPPHIFNEVSCQHYFGGKVNDIKHLDRQPQGKRFTAQVECYQDLWVLGGGLK